MSVVESALRERFELRLFDSRRERGERGALARGAGFLALAGRLLGVLLRRRPRVVHVLSVSGRHFYQHAILASVALALRRRVVFHVHGGGFEDFYRGQRPLPRALSDRFLARVDAVVCPSRWSEQALRRLCPALRPLVLPNPVDCEAFAAPLGRRDDGALPSVLFVGTTDGALNRAKGLYELLGAVGALAARGTRCRLVLAGCDVTDAAEERAIAALGEATDTPIEVHRAVAGEEKVALFRGADVFALPSHVENSPFTVLEAMSAGCAVVATRVGGIPDEITDGVNGFLCVPGDGPGLEGALGRLLVDAALRAEMGRANVRRARAEHDVHVVSVRLGRLYDTLSGGHTPGRVEERAVA